MDTPFTRTGDPPLTANVIDLNQEQRILQALADKLEGMLLDPQFELTPAMTTAVLKFLSDNAVTMASVRRGKFGDFVKEQAETFPSFEDEEPAHQFQ